MTDQSAIRPHLPADLDSAPWWDHLRRHELGLQRCDHCTAWRWPARAICGQCGSFETTWTVLSGRGTVASWIVNHHAFSAAFASPYPVVTVRLLEQPDLLLVGSFEGPIDDLRIDRAVEAVFVEIGHPEGDRAVVSPKAPGPQPAADGITLLSWRSAGAQAHPERI